MPITLNEYLEAPVNLERLIAKLDFHEEDVERATREQASLFLEACRYRVKKLRSKVAAKTNYEQKYARVAMQFRALKKKGQTEGSIKDRVPLHSSVREAKKALDKATVAEEFAELMTEAYKQRFHACRILASILGAEASAELRVTQQQIGRDGMKKLRNKVAQRFTMEDE